MEELHLYQIADVKASPFLGRMHKICIFAVLLQTHYKCHNVSKLKNIYHKENDTSNLKRKFS